MADCNCPARFSGNDEEQYRAHGCPNCVCGIIEDKGELPDKRYLMYHPESDCWFEVFTAEHRLQCISNDGCDDVTDDPKHEAEFIKYKEENGTK